MSDVVNGAIVWAILIYAVVALFSALWRTWKAPYPKTFAEPWLQMIETMWKSWGWPVVLVLWLRRVVGMGR